MVCTVNPRVWFTGFTVLFIWFSPEIQSKGHSIGAIDGELIRHFMN